MIELLFYLTIIFNFIGIILFIFVIRFLIAFKNYKKEIENLFDNKFCGTSSDEMHLDMDVDELGAEVINLREEFKKIDFNLSSQSTSFNMTIAGIRSKISEALNSLKEGMEILEKRISLMEGNLNGYKEKIKNKVKKEINQGLRELKHKGKLE